MQLNILARLSYLLMCQYAELFALNFISAGELYSAKGNCTKLKIFLSFVATDMHHTGIFNRQVLCYCSIYIIKALCCRSLTFPEPPCVVVLFCSLRHKKLLVQWYFSHWFASNLLNLCNSCSMASTLRPSCP